MSEGRSEYEMKQRRRAQAAEDKLTDLREAARGAFNGVRGTSRTTDSDDVRVTFTDRGWEACKRMFSVAGVDEPSALDDRDDVPLDLRSVKPGRG